MPETSPSPSSRAGRVPKRFAAPPAASPRAPWRPSRPKRAVLPSPARRAPASFDDVRRPSSFRSRRVRASASRSCSFKPISAAHSRGYPIHFAEGPGETPTDGAELTFFVWREFCERAEPPSIQRPSVSEFIELLRKLMRRSGRQKI